jgi:TolB-like protein
LTPHTVIVPVARSLGVPDAFRPLVAVLSFTAPGDDPDLQMLGAELADALRDRLGQEPDLRTILINSDFIAKAPPHAVELVCRELRVGHLVSGRCHGPAHAPSLYVEVTDTREWHIQWAHFFRASARSVLAIDGAPMTGLVAGLRSVLVNRRR